MSKKNILNLFSDISNETKNTSGDDTLSAIFDKLNEELNTRSKRYKKKSLFESNFDLKATVDDELNEIDFKKVVGKVKEIGTKAIVKAKAIFAKIKSKVKQIEKVGFRLGNAIVKLSNGKYGIMDRKGEMVTKLQYDKLERAKIPGTNKKAILGKLKSKGGKTLDGVFQPDGKLAYASGSSGSRFILVMGDVLQPKLQLEQRIEKSLRFNLLTEADDDDDEDLEDLESLKGAVADEGLFIGLSENSLLVGKEDLPEIKNHIVTSSELAKTLERETAKITTGSKTKDTFASGVIFGPSGVGKTTIIKESVKKAGFEVFILELAQIDKDMISGIPRIDSTGESPVTRITPTTLLPDSDDPRKHCLFFDEFNRADRTVQNAVMNLISEGTIRGARFKVKINGKEVEKNYSLPKNTLILLANNSENEEGLDNTQDVEDATIAMSSRLGFMLNLKADAPGWLDMFATLPGKFEDATGEYMTMQNVPTLITAYVEDIWRTTGDVEKPFQKKVSLYAGEGGVESSTDARRWTQLGDDLRESARTKWKGMSDEEKSKYEDDAVLVAARVLNKPKSKITEKEIKFWRFAAFLENKDFLVKELSAWGAKRLGEDGDKYIAEIIDVARKKVAAGYSQADLIFDYLKIAKIAAKQGSKFGGGSSLLEKAVAAFEKIKTLGKAKAFMKQENYEVSGSHVGPDGKKRLYKDQPLELYFAIILSHMIDDMVDLKKLDPDELVVMADKIDDSTAPLVIAIGRNLRKVSPDKYAIAYAALHADTEEAEEAVDKAKEEADDDDFWDDDDKPKKEKPKAEAKKAEPKAEAKKEKTPEQKAATKERTRIRKEAEKEGLTVKEYRKKQGL